MSTCLIITQGDKMYIGADSACSVKTPDGFRRYSDDMQKLFRLNEQIFFCSGNMSKVYECVDWIYNHFTHSICIEDLKDYLIDNYNEYLDEYYNIEILIADYKTNVVYQLSQYNNFEILTYPYSEQLRIICGGYKTKDAFIMTKKNILLKQSIHNIYHNTYQDIADECVGGYLYLYSSPTDFRKVKIIEDNIKYVCMDNELHLLTSEFVTSGFINGTQIIGGDIFSQNYGQSTGCHIDLYNGHFSLGGGALKWDGTTLSISSPDIPTTAQITKITKDTVTTSYVNALNVTAKKVSTDWVYAGNVTAGQIKTGSIVSTNGYTNINLDNGSFSFANGGLTYSASNGLSVSGKIIATDGTIGGWTITSTDIYDANNDASAGVGKCGTSYAFWAGTTYDNRNSAPFRVGHDGSLTSANANITGGTISTTGNNNKEKIVISSGALSFQYNNYTPSTIKSIISNSGTTNLQCLTSGNFSVESGGGIQFNTSGDSNVISLSHKSTGHQYLLNSIWGGVITGGLMVDSETVASSDRDKKYDIEDLDYKKTLDFIYSIIPRKFKYKNGESGRFHHGFIAQEIKETMGEDDWGVYIDDTDNGKGIRYGELIADIVLVLQSQNQRITELENEVRNLNG